MLIPALLLVLFLFLSVINPGLEKGIDLQGGTLIIVRADTEIPKDSLEAYLNSEFDLSDLQVNTISSPTGGFGATIQFSENEQIAAAKNAAISARDSLQTNESAARASALEAINIAGNFVETPNTANLSAKELANLAQELVNEAEAVLLQSLIEGIKQQYNLGENARFQQRSIGPVLGESFYQNAITVSIAALILVTIVIFLFFRKIIPSVAVMLAAAFDIIAALGFMAFFEIPLSLATIPALLMLVGYSIDTNIMLTTRLIKRGEGSLLERSNQALITGLTMTLTTSAALLAMVFFAYYAQITVIFNIAIVLFFGLLGDIVSTWLMNAPILLWYLKRKGEVVE